MGSSPPLRTLVSLLDLQCASALHGSSSSWTVVRPTRVPKHRAQCAGDGRRARRLAEVRAEPFPASLLVRRHSCAAGRNEQTSCQSRRAAARPAARKQLLLPPRCRRASTSSNASARARPPSRSRAQTSLPTAGLARRGAFCEEQQRLKIQTIRFAGDGRRIAPKEKFDKRKPPLRARLPAVVIN